VANVVGTGFTPHPLFGIDDKDEAAAASAEWVRAAQLKFRRWSMHADADGGNFDEVVRLAVRGMFEAGEAFVVRVSNGDAPAGVPLQLRVWEAEMLPLWKNELSLEAGGYIRAGIEFDADGRRAAYWFYQEHPGEFAISIGQTTALQRVPASEVLHFFRPIRPGQVRGEPFLAPVVIRLADLGGYLDAEVVRKKAAANFVFKMEAPNPDTVSDSVGDLHNKAAEDGEVDTKPGTVVVPGVGETFDLVQPADVGPNFAAFVQGVLHEIAAGAFCTYEALTGDLTGVNYSSIRAGIVEYRRRIEPIQYGIVGARLTDLWAWWLDAAVVALAVPAPRYVTWREDYLDIAWVPPGWDWVDPLKDVAAKADELAIGITSLTRIAKERGEDINEIFRERADEMKTIKALGLDLVTPQRSQRLTSTSVSAPPPVEEDPAGTPAPAKTGTNG